MYLLPPAWSFLSPTGSQPSRAFPLPAVGLQVSPREAGAGEGKRAGMLAGRTDSPPNFPQLSAQNCTVVSTGSAKWRLPARPGVLTPDGACSLPGSPEKLGQTGPKELSHPPPHLIPTVFCPRHS